MHPGEYILGDRDIELNAGRATTRILVSNQGDRPIQVGSHYHFFRGELGAQFRSPRGLRHAPRCSRRNRDPL